LPLINGSEPTEQGGGAVVQVTFAGLQLRASTQRPATQATSADEIPREAHAAAKQAMLQVAIG
jgi:hypothetical protein